MCVLPAAVCGPVIFTMTEHRNTVNGMDADALAMQGARAVDETDSHDQVAHKIGCLYIPLLF